MGSRRAIVSVDPPFFYYDVDPTRGAKLAELINLGLRDMHTRQPDRLRWMATVPLQDPDTAAAMLREAQVRGLRRRGDRHQHRGAAAR